MGKYEWKRKHTSSKPALGVDGGRWGLNSKYPGYPGRRHEKDWPLISLRQQSHTLARPGTHLEKNRLELSSTPKIHSIRQPLTNVPMDGAAGKAGQGEASARGHPQKEKVSQKRDQKRGDDPGKCPEPQAPSQSQYKRALSVFFNRRMCTEATFNAWLYPFQPLGFSPLPPWWRHQLAAENPNQLGQGQHPCKTSRPPGAKRIFIVPRIWEPRSLPC